MILDCEHVLMNTSSMAITPKAIQDLLDELEASKQSRLRAWNVLQRLRTVLSEVGNVPISPPAQKTFEEEGETLEHALRKSIRLQNDAMKTLCSSVRRFRDATIKEECKRDYPQSKIKTTQLRRLAIGIDSKLGQRPLTALLCKRTVRLAGSEGKPKLEGQAQLDLMQSAEL
jgi:hypothetical protein